MKEYVLRDLIMLNIGKNIKKDVMDEELQSTWEVRSRFNKIWKI